MRLSSASLECSSQKIYTHCIVLKTDDVSHGLERARSSKREFSKGEARGVEFMKAVEQKMASYMVYFNSTAANVCQTDSVDAVFEKLRQVLNV